MAGTLYYSFIDGFGTRDGDICFVAESDGVIVGAVWVRIMDDYGHIDDKTPSFASCELTDCKP